MALKLKFNRNYAGKLNADVFSTFRLPASTHLEGNVFDVYLGEKYLFQAQLIIKTVFANKYENVFNLPHILTQLDAGLQPYEFAQLFTDLHQRAGVKDWNTQPINYLVFRKLSPSPSSI